MTLWARVAIALALAPGGALYIHLRWHRSPQAYRPMIALAVCYFVAGSIAGAWLRAKNVVWTASLVFSSPSSL